MRRKLDSQLAEMKHQLHDDGWTNIRQSYRKASRGKPACIVLKGWCVALPGPRASTKRLKARSKRSAGRVKVAWFADEKQTTSRQVSSKWRKNAEVIRGKRRT